MEVYQASSDLKDRNLYTVQWGQVTYGLCVSREGCIETAHYWLDGEFQGPADIDDTNTQRALVACTHGLEAGHKYRMYHKVRGWFVATVKGIYERNVVLDIAGVGQVNTYLHLIEKVTEL